MRVLSAASDGGVERDGVDLTIEGGAGLAVDAGNDTGPYVVTFLFPREIMA